MIESQYLKSYLKWTSIILTCKCLLQKCIKFLLDKPLTLWMVIIERFAVAQKQQNIYDQRYGISYIISFWIWKTWTFSNWWLNFRSLKNIHISYIRGIYHNHITYYSYMTITCINVIVLMFCTYSFIETALKTPCLWINICFMVSKLHSKCISCKPKKKFNNFPQVFFLSVLWTVLLVALTLIARLIYYLLSLLKSYFMMQKLVSAIFFRWFFFHLSFNLSVLHVAQVSLDIYLYYICSIPSHG